MAAEHSRATVRPDKAATVAEIAESFRSSTATVLTEYRGLSVKQISDLRRSLGADTTYSVVKNTLTKLAAKDAGVSEVEQLLQGPTAVAFVKGDPVLAAKGLRDFAKAHPLLVIKGGILDGKTMSAEEIRKLADLESREVLLAKLAGAMKASLSQAVYLFNAPLAQVARLAGALQAKAEADPSVLRGGAGTPAPVQEAAEATEAPAAEATEATEAPAAEAPEATEATEAPAAEAPEATEATEAPAAEATEAPAAEATEAPAEADTSTPGETSTETTD